MARPDDDLVLEYHVIAAPLCRVIVGWTFPAADASALIGSWQREGFRYASAVLVHRWKVAFVALRDPSSEDEADAWWKLRTTLTS